MADAAGQPSSSNPPTARKKFANPPVKIACLACRASRVRCNGEKPCASCKTKERECEYRPSRRGGPRIRKKSRIFSDFHELGTSLPTKSEEVPQESLAVPNFINPGAGLKALEDVWKDSDAMYDQLFQNPTLSKIPVARSYGGNNAAILNAYYIWIHPYFPILPAPQQTPFPDTAVPLPENHDDQLDEPSSAVALAISAILALIPCPQDSSPLDPESIRWRRKYSYFLSKAAIENVESEHDRPETEEPADTLDGTSDEPPRDQFHPCVPVELESIIALDLLSIYEYAQRGNLKKMRARAGAALVSAMNLQLHIRSDYEDGYAEARRRAWWMTYVCVSQGSIVGNTPATFEVFSTSFTAKYPLIRSDPEAWSIFIQSQQAILAATQFVIELNKAKESNGNMNRIFDRMRELESRLEPLITKSEGWKLELPVTHPMEPEELVLSQSLRCIARIKMNSARIKVHRYCAFFDIAVFSRKHCDLKPVGDLDGSGVQQVRSCCSTLSGTPSIQSSRSPDSAASSNTWDQHTPTTEDAPHIHQHASLSFPFTTEHSSQICLRCALNITEAFDLLPYPSPNGQVSASPCYMGPGSSLVAPRTMPAFACCAMQSSYALLMTKERIQAEYPAGEEGGLTGGFFDRVQQGLLSMLLTLENYASAFEALSGMRDQVREKVGLTLAFDAFKSEWYGGVGAA